MFAQINSFLSGLSTADLIVAAGVVATGLQYLINRFANVKKFTNQLLGIVMPFLVTAPLMIDSLKNNFGAYSALVYVVAQLIYYVVEKIKANAAAPVLENV